MPLPVAAKVGIIATTVVVAAAIAIYESPEVRRQIEELRRRVAIALHSFGDNLDPDRRNSEPRFNRPEDAQGFYESAVDGDEETRRRQREELLYWNARREEQKRKEQEEGVADRSSRPSRSRGSSFDDFLKPDGSAERGTFVYKTGASVWDSEANTLRRRGGVEGVRGLNASMIHNPFSDEHGIELDERIVPEPLSHSQYGVQLREEEPEQDFLAPDHDEVAAASDIYAATPLVQSLQVSQPQAQFPAGEARSELATLDMPQTDGFATPLSRRSSVTLDRELADDEYMTAGQSDRHEAYSSIQAWAQHSNTGFYSPLPVSPQGPISEPELISEGALTPTDSVSVVGSGEDITNEVASNFDVMSEFSDGVATPNSWSDVGSVVSENDAVHA